MSASIGVLAATVMVMAIGGDTREAMKVDVWRQAGLCSTQCHWSDASPECLRREKRNLPCEVNHSRAQFWDNYWKPELPWQDAPAWTYSRPLTQPEWVLSTEPTAYGRDGLWLKLRL